LIRILFVFPFLTLLMGAATAWSQAPAESPYYARTNTFSIFSAYSGDSSHILLGKAENRMLLEFGAAYGRKLFLNRIVNWQYNGELLPVALESDPHSHLVFNQTLPTVATGSYDSEPEVSCAPVTTPYSWTLANGVTYSGTFTQTCHGRQWTIGEAISPVGFQWNFLPRRKTQPFLIGHGGYMYSTQPIPISTAGSFNFTFDFGAGLELYRSKTRSIRAEYRIHHISNHGTAHDNPGIDNGLFQLTYSFGK
jgi:hypothetical protein